MDTGLSGPVCRDQSENGIGPKLSLRRFLQRLDRLECPSTRSGVRNFVIGAHKLERFALGYRVMMECLVTLGQHLDRHAGSTFDRHIEDLTYPIKLISPYSVLPRSYFYTFWNVSWRASPNLS